MDCSETKELLVDYIYGELSDEERAMIEAHLRTCGACAAELAQLKKTRSALALLGSEAPALKKEVPATRVRRPVLRRLLAYAAAGAVAALLLITLFPEPTGTRPRVVMPPIFPQVQAGPTVERTSVGLTVYNGGFGVVRDGRLVRRLPAGECVLSFVDVAAKIEPHTVKLRSLTHPPGVTVLAQDFLFDLIGAQRLLEKRIGERVKLLLTDGSEDAGLLQGVSPGELIIASDRGGLRTMATKEIRLIKFEGKVAAGLVSRPTLKWLLGVAPGAAGNNELELSYLTQGVTWRSDYDLILGDKTELLCWLTLTNNCGTAFEDAKLKLVAGEVHRAPVEKRKDFGEAGGMANKAAKAAPQVKEKKFFEYHMYEVMRPVTVKNGQTKQIKMFERVIENIGKEYWITAYPHVGMDAASVRRKAQVVLLFKNSKENGLGIPLPAGRVRLFVPIGGENLFARNSHIEHTPKDEDVKLPFGQTESVVWRVAASQMQRGQNFQKGEQQLLLRNLSDSDAKVLLRIKLSGDWKITKSSHQFEKEDAQTALFNLSIKAGEEINVEYSWEIVR